MKNSEVQPIVHAVWDEKYRWKKPDGSSTEQSPEDSMKRVVDGVYAQDATGKDEALQAMLNREWCPAGRVHAGAGTDKRVTLINCYVSPDIEDSMATERNKNSKGIMESLTVAALTQQMGGGIGMDFSTIRPRGAIVRRTGSASSGVLPFMDMWHSMCSTIMSSGSRRGAMMGTLRCDHTDLREFIAAKHEKGRLTNFNVSVLVTDEFMEAVREDGVWELGFKVPRADNNHVDIRMPRDETGERKWYIYERCSARELWNEITKSTYQYAEPGVMFIDRINQWNNLWYCEYIHCSNPCGEQPLPPNGDCNLGAVNLAVMVKNPFTDQAEIKWDRIAEVAAIGIRFLDNVLDVTLYPTDEMKWEAMNKRRTGLGITGLGNLLQQMKVRYGSEDAIQLTKRIMRTIRDAAYSESVNLSTERGPFPLFDRDKYVKGRFVQTLPDELQGLIFRQGIRNGVLMTIAPTGTTSIYYGNVSSGLEPTYAWSYRRKMLKPDGSFEEFEKVEDYGYRLYREIVGEPTKGDPVPPDYMVTALDLPVRDHVVMQAACQQYVDASISKTINCPVDMSFDEFQDVYSMAYDMGLKGCTTYRPSPERGSVMSTDEGDNYSVVEDVIARPEELDGTTYKVRWPKTEHAFYVTITDYVDQRGNVRPFEVFINSKSVEHQEWITALTRTVSAIFRRGGDVTFLIEELEQVHSSLGGQWVKGRYVPSLVAMIGMVLERHFKKLGLLEKDDDLYLAGETDREGVEIEREEQDVLIKGSICPKCQSPAVIQKEGCGTCLNCGYSNCG